MKHSYLFFTVAALALSPGVSDAATVTLQSVGNIGGTDTFGQALSADGSTAIGFGYIAGNSLAHPFAWTNGVMTDLGTFGGDLGMANGVNADGSVVVGYASLTGNNQTHAFRWTSNGGMVDLGTLGGDTSDANAVNANGTVVVGNSVLSGNALSHAFRWTSGGGMVDLGSLGGNTSYAQFVSTDGAVVAGQSYLTGNVLQHGFRWTNGSGMVDIGSLGGLSSTINGMSANGAILVGYSEVSSSVDHAFSWTSGTGMVDLGTLGGGYSQATGISADGTTIVGSAVDNSSNSLAVRWVNGVIHDLGSLGGTYGSADAVSANGNVIVGLAEDTNSQFVPFRWTQATGMQTISDILTAAGVNLTGWDFTNHYYQTRVSADGKVVMGTVGLNGHSQVYLMTDQGITTPQSLSQAIALSTKAVEQTVASISQSFDYGLLATRQALSNFVSRNSPSGISSGDGYSRFGMLAPQNISVYAYGSYGIGQDNNFSNHNTSGATGMFAHVTDDLAMGVGMIGGRGETQMLYGGKTNSDTLGGAVNMAYEQKNGLRLYGTAVLANLDVKMDRNYLNGAGIDGSRGKTSGLGYGTAVRAGWSFPLQQGTSIMPYEEIQASRVSLDAYQETGGAFAASFNKQSLTSVSSHLGAEITHDLNKDITLRGRAAWGHRLNNNPGSVTGTVIGITQTVPFSTGDRDWAEVGTTANWKITPSTNFTTDIAGRIGETSDPAVAVTVGFSVGF